jgi:hypothetical protein
LFKQSAEAKMIANLAQDRVEDQRLGRRDRTVCAWPIATVDLERIRNYEAEINAPPVTSRGTAP